MTELHSAFNMENTSTIDHPQTVARLLKKRERRKLMASLSRIEDGTIRLHEILHAWVEQNCATEVQGLMIEIQQDAKSILQLCVSGVDPFDPQISIDHDHVNNDRTLGLYERLAYASEFGCRRRVLFIHQLQREICARLKELGINTSMNAKF